jgi:uncharacterized membrane protein
MHTKISAQYIKMAVHSPHPAFHRKALAPQAAKRHSGGMQTLSSLPAQTLIHLFAAIAATVIGPLAIWARLSGKQRPKLHRAFGYAWVTLMLITAISAVFIHSHFPMWWRFSWIHLFVPATLIGLVIAFWFLSKGNLRGHRLTMIQLYIGACLIAGAFTLAPNRFLGSLLWS